jgi:hypothetical protein
MFRKLVPLIISLVLIIRPEAIFAQNKVRAQGMATIHNSLIDIARTKAIDEAQRNAVEKVVGVMVSSATEIENYQTKLDLILSESKGYLNSYEIVSEEREGNQYRVVLDADVGIEKLRDRMDAVNMILTRKSKPRVLIMIHNGAKRDSLAEAAITKYLMEKGFKLVTCDLSEKRSIPQMADAKQVAQMGQICGAEIVFMGNVDVATSPFEVGSVAMRFNKVTSTAKAVKADTGEVMASDAIVGSRTGMDDVVKLLIEETGQKLAQNIADQVLEKWSFELTNTANIKIMISGLNSFQDLGQFKEELMQSAKGIKNLHQRSFRQNTAEFDVEIKGTTLGLAEDIAAMSLGKNTIRITGITQNKIEAAILSDSGQEAPPQKKPGEK